MTKVKSVYGEHRTWEEHFWAYSVTNGKAVLVRCPSMQAACEEKERMKHSNARTVGYTRAKISELDMRTKLRERGWRIEVIR